MTGGLRARHSGESALSCKLHTVRCTTSSYYCEMQCKAPSFCRREKREWLGFNLSRVRQRQGHNLPYTTHRGRCAKFAQMQFAQCTKVTVCFRDTTSCKVVVVQIAICTECALHTVHIVRCAMQALEAVHNCSGGGWIATRDQDLSLILLLEENNSHHKQRQDHHHWLSGTMLQVTTWAMTLDCFGGFSNHDVYWPVEPQM